MSDNRHPTVTGAGFTPYSPDLLVREGKEQKDFQYGIFFVIIVGMEKLQNRIRLNYSDPEINGLLRSAGSSNGTNAANYTRHYSQNEEFFLKLDQEYFVPSFPIHHDVRETRPSMRYSETLKIVLNSIVPLVPDLFKGLTYYFDPSDTLRPAFFQLYRLGDEHYLFLMKVDLGFKPTEHEVLQPGTNDATPEYRCSKIFIDSIVVPVEQVEMESGRVSSFGVRQTVSQTWIGETGRGYFVQGIWMDHELTKFFSKLFLPANKRTYPYYPFQCRYRTICATVIAASSEERKKSPPLLHHALQFVVPTMDYIQDSLRNNDFSTDLETFQTLKRKVPEYWNTVWNELEVKMYLNGRDMKEFLIAP